MYNLLLEIMIIINFPLYAIIHSVQKHAAFSEGSEYKAEWIIVME